jgi:hypothetical protein
VFCINWRFMSSVYAASRFSRYGVSQMALSFRNDVAASGDLWQDIAHLLPANSDDAQTALHRARHCNTALRMLRRWQPIVCHGLSIPHPCYCEYHGMLKSTFVGWWLHTLMAPGPSALKPERTERSLHCSLACNQLARHVAGARQSRGVGVVRPCGC